MSPDHFTCARCGGTFEKGRSDEDALAEMQQLFGDLPAAEQAVVCDDCWTWMETERQRRGIPLDAFRTNP